MAFSCLNLQTIKTIVSKDFPLVSDAPSFFVSPECSKVMSIFFKSFLVGTGALIAAMLLVLISVPLFGDTLRISMFINAVIGCYSIGSSVSYYCMKQTEKYKAALVREEKLHEQLLDAHQQLKTRSRLDMICLLYTSDAADE